MRKIRIATYVVAMTLAAAAMTGSFTETAYAEEVTLAVATDTDAVETTDAPEAEVTTETEAEDVAIDEVTVAGDNDAYYNININGGDWDGIHYTVGGNVITNAFFCDGEYTYYLQADGTPMKDRLTYHPNGEDIIYFDLNGHEVFSDYANITKSIAGESVNDLCFFDTYGYMYVNKLTYDKEGKNLYYVNECGVIERGNRWFKFPYAIEDITGEETYMKGGYGFATESGALLTNQFTYNQFGQMVYIQGNGLMATGLLNVGGVYYLFDMNDGHIVQTYTSMPGEYSLIEYDSDGGYSVSKYNGEKLIGTDSYSANGQQTYHFETNRTGNVEKASSWNLDGTEICTYNWTFTYDEYDNILIGEQYEKYVTRDEKGEVEWHEYTTHTEKTYYAAAAGKASYAKSLTYNMNGELTEFAENYYNNDEDNCLSGRKICYYENGVPMQITELLMYEHSDWDVYMDKTTVYNQGDTSVIISYYDINGNELYYYIYDEDGHKLCYGRYDEYRNFYFEAYNIDGSVAYTISTD